MNAIPAAAHISFVLAPTALAFLVLAPTALAQTAGGDGVDWPQWRGPDRTGVSTEASWNPAGSSSPLWRKSIGLGHSSFAVVGGHVYTLGYDAEQKVDTVFCLDAETGEEIWTVTYGAEIWDTAHDGGALTTPTVVDDAVYTSNREGKVFCFDAKTGDVRWSRDLRTELELEPHTWGFSASPLIVGDLVVMNVDRVVALDRATGDDVWITERKYGISYSTPAEFELDGRALLANLTGDGLGVLDLTDGAEVAFFEWVKRPQIYPMTPVVIDNKIFISGGYDRGCVMLELNGGELTELWGGRMMRNKMSGCVLWEDHLFGFDESILKCIDLEGKMKWRVRGLGTGSMTIAGGRLVILDGKGQIIVAEANPDEYVELSKQSVFDDGTGWSSPVLSHGRIYCRSSKGQMACLDHRGEASLAIAASARDGGETPAVDALLARHLDGLGGAAAFADVTRVRMTGPGESLRNTVDTGAVTLDWSAKGSFSWRDGSGFQLAHDAKVAWTTGLRAGPEILEGEMKDAVREAGNLARVFDPSSAYTAMRTTGRTTFDNRPCFAVAATTSEGHERILYFDVATGMFAGHEGEGIPLWTLGDYREVEGVVLPMKWAFYEPELGEMTSAAFETVTLDPPADEERFAHPPIVKLLMRSPEEIEADNERLTKLHEKILGAWRSDDPEEGDEDLRFYVEAGFLQIAGGGGPPARMTEPDDRGVLRILGAEYVSLTPIKGDSGEIEAFELRIGPDLEDTFRRPKD